MSRRYPDRPILGVGAVVVEGDCILLVERSSPPLEGYWSLPGGAVEVGEMLEDAVRRELLEETGLEVEPLAVVEVFERIDRDTEGRFEYHYVVIDYLCRVRGGELRAASDARRAEWAPRAALSGYKLTEGALRVIEKALVKRNSEFGTV